MRGLRRAALVLAPAVAGTGVNAQASFPTAVIPLDLGDHELGRELTLLFNVAEANTICGPSQVQINGQDLAVDEDRSGHGTFLEDYGSEITASWQLDCVEVDGEPLKQTIAFTIEAVDGDAIDHVNFAVHFRQAAPAAILGFDGAASEARIVDGDEEYSQPTYWELFGDDVVYEDENEVDVARAEMEYLRRQRQEIDDRIVDLHNFITESEPSDGQCKTFWCWLRSIFDALTGAASKSHHDMANSASFGGPHHGHKFPFPFPHHGHKHHHNHTHGNHTHPHPPHKRPHWLPPFCRPPHHPPPHHPPPHHPKKPHHPYPHPPPEDPPKNPPDKQPPHHPHQPYQPDPPTEPHPPDMPHPPDAPRPPHIPDPPAEASGSLVERPRPKGERPLGGVMKGQSPKHGKPQLLPHNGKMPFSVQVSIEICVIALVLLAVTGAIHRCATRRARRKQQFLRNALREYCRRVRSERRAARTEARRRRKEQFKAWFRNLFYRLTGQLGDEEKCAAQNEVRAPLNDEEQQQPPQRERAESAASNTMEQDIAQFREVVGIVGNLIGAEERHTEREAATMRTVSVHRDAGPVPPHMAPSLPASNHPSYVNYAVYPPPPSPQHAPVDHHEQDLPPPAYESEDEDTLVSSSIVTDGFRYMSGDVYTPSQGGGGSTSGSDELGYNNKP